MGDDPPVVRLAGARYRCHARWRQLGQPPWAQRWLSVGELAGGRWYVQVVAQVHVPARGYPDAASALAAARRLRQWYGGQWEEAPCYPTADAVAAQPRQR